MKNQRSRFLLGGCAALVAILIASCSPVDCADVSNYGPTQGQSFMLVTYSFNAGGDVIVDRFRDPKFDTIKTTAVATIFPDPLQPAGIGFADSVIRNGRVIS